MKGFTLLEVLLASVLGLLVFALLLSLFLHLSASGRLGEGRLANQLRARQTMRRLVPLVRLAASPNTAKDGVYLPDQNVTASNVVFSSPDDLMDPNPAAFDPRNPVYTLYQVRFDAAARQLTLQEIYAPGRSDVIATDIVAFNVTRTHPNGVILRLKTEAQVRDLRGTTRTVDYSIDEAIEVPQ